jgi:hypothetical protein
MVPIQITMSFGVAGREGSNQSPKDIIHHADIALYHAKLTGRNRTSIYDEGAYHELAEEQASGNAVPRAQSLEERIKLCEFPTECSPASKKGLRSGSIPAVEVEYAGASTSVEATEEIKSDEQGASEEAVSEISPLSASHARFLSMLAMLLLSSVGARWRSIGSVRGFYRHRRSGGVAFH